VKRMHLLVSMCLAIAVLPVHEYVHAAGIESLVMPGSLIKGHARYENECNRCHRPFSKGQQRTLCLDCHEDVAADVKTGHGYHGLSGSGKAKCSTCHEDHKGRDANVMQFSKETFNHDMTDYPLHGQHKGIECNLCHEQGKKFRDAPAYCNSCHVNDDVHKGNLGEKCQECHNDKGWKKRVFDHNDTDYVLRGKHKDVACNSCHAGERYEGTPTVCIDCHRFSDVHAGRYGKKCNDCHRESNWKKIVFDHDRNTDYPLTGKHRQVACDTCHGGNLFDQDIGTGCIACHRNDDEHKGQYGERCDACHGTGDWGKVKFDHDKETGFPLKGRHTKLLCSACHRGELNDETLGSNCLDCHKSDDVHEGKQGEDCASCHNEKNWAENVRFEHDMTRFPLIGMHVVAPCEECHLSAVFTDAAITCNECHERDDIHKQRLGPKCEVCHNPNAWSLWEFDHNTRTGFKLDGSHESLDCHACHTQPVRKKINQTTSCNGCHREDDIHDGRFGHFCERCHDTVSFKSVQIR